MNYACPHCNQGYTIGETYYRGGNIFSCTSCKKKSVIPLYCPQCCPVNVQTKTWLNPPTGEWEGRSFRCPSGHSFMVFVTSEGAHERLRKWGAEVGQYHQSSRIATLTDNATRSAVSGGYCSGACYDWIRRVLISSTPKLTYKNLESSMPSPGTGQRTAEMQKQHRQDHRAALMQRQDINPLLTTKNNQLFQKLTSDNNAAYQTYCRENGRINGMPGTATVKQPLWDENERLYNEACAANRRAYDSKVSAPPVEKVWTEFRKKMDEAIRQQRQAAGKTGYSARPFENLDLVAASASKEYTGTGLRKLISEAINHSEFKADYCAHIGVNPPDGGTGHAVAVHRQNTGGKYHFFDPNFGVYEFTKANLVDAFVFIFGTAYPNWAGGGTSDDHPYEVNGRTKGNWSIFKGNRVPAPTVTETPQPIEVRVETPVTLTIVRTMPNIPVTTQSGPVVTGVRTTSPQTTGTQTPSTGLKRFQINGKWYEAVNYKAASEMAKSSK